MLKVLRCKCRCRCTADDDDDPTRKCTVLALLRNSSTYYQSYIHGLQAVSLPSRYIELCA